MSADNEQSGSDQVIRLSFWWLMLGGIAVLILGLVGGVLAQQLWRPSVAPLGGNGDKFVSTVQQVTISPNKAAADMVQAAQRSVVVLRSTTGDQTNTLGTGLVLTNDGVIVTSATMPDATIAAFDGTGQPIRIDRIGQDALFGLTYFRAPDAVLVPLDLAREDAGVGMTLVSVSRELISLLPRTALYHVSQYGVPTESTALGIQKLLQGTPTTLERMNGSPVLDDEGKVRGIVLDAAAGTVIPVSQLQVSLDRLTNNQRERNPVAELGLTIRPNFQVLTPDQPIAFVEQITAVTPNSAAYQAGLQRGDIVTKINDQSLTWNQSVVTQLGEKLPLTLTFMRNGQSSTVTIQSVPTPTP